ENVPTTKHLGLVTMAYSTSAASPTFRPPKAVRLMAWTRSVMLWICPRSRGIVGSRWSEKPSCSSVRTPGGWADSIADPFPSCTIDNAREPPASLAGIIAVRSTIHWVLALSAARHRAPDPGRTVHLRSARYHSHAPGG